MTLKNDEKSEEELTCRFKIDMRNFFSLHSICIHYTIKDKKKLDVSQAPRYVKGAWD